MKKLSFLVCQAWAFFVWGGFIQASVPEQVLSGCLALSWDAWDSEIILYSKTEGWSYLLDADAEQENKLTALALDNACISIQGEVNGNVIEVLEIIE